MKMSPEEKFNQKVWWALRTIKEKSLFLKRGQYHSYDRWIKVSSLMREERELIIEKLNEWRAIDIKQDIFEDENKDDYFSIMTFRIEYPKFDQTYEKFRKLNEAIPDRKKSGARIVLNLNKGDVIYTDSEGKDHEAKFNKNTSEYLILLYLARNKGSVFSTSELIDENLSLLKGARDHAEDASPKQRVIDKIKAIRKKLDKDVIKSESGGYVVDCEVIMA